MLRLVLIVLLLVGSAEARAEPALAFDGRISLGPAWDSNVARRSEGAGVAADEAMFFLASFDLRWKPGEGHLTTISWDGGSRVFADQRSEDQVAQVIGASHAMRLSSAFVASADLRRRDQLLRSGERDAAESAAQLSLRWDVARTFAPQIRAGWRRFDWWPDERWSSAGPTAGIGLVFRPFPRHQASAGYEAQLRDYPHRRELAHQGHVGWSWRGSILLGGGYLLGVADSDVPGYEHVRHRLHLLLGMRLPAELMLGAQAVLQLVRFPAGFHLDRFTVADDEESLSSLSLKLARPIGGGVSLEARYQLHLATFLRSDLAYERHLLGSAVTWRF